MLTMVCPSCGSISIVSLQIYVKGFTPQYTRFCFLCGNQRKLDKKSQEEIEEYFIKKEK